jgi:hypothetical protein
MRPIRASRISVTEKRLFLARFRIAPMMVLLAACGGNAAQPRNAIHENTAPPSWPTLSWEDRHTTMTFTVLPNMGRAWQKFPKSDAPTLTCRSCHGAKAEGTRYKMPNPNLPKLDPAHMPSKTSSDANEARWATFMIDEVVPQMTSLMDTTPSFGCFNCHTKKTP